MDVVAAGLGGGEKVVNGRESGLVMPAVAGAVARAGAPAPAQVGAEQRARRQRRRETVAVAQREMLRRGLMLATIAWVFGAVWLNATTGTPVTNYARQMGASKFQFGLIAAMPFLASLLSLPASLLIEATGKRKKIFLWALYAQRAMWFPLALLPLWIVYQHGEAAGEVALSLFLVLFFLMHAGQAIGGPAWVSWMADLVPDRIRGTYFSRRRALGMLSAIPAAYLVGWILDYAKVSSAPMGLMVACAVVMMVAAVCGLADIHLFQYVPDVPKPAQKGRHLLRAMREPLKNRQFLFFAGFVGTLTFAVSFMTQFVTLYVMEQLAAGEQARTSLNRITQMMVVVAPSVGMVLVLGVWGRIADRMGKKPLLIMTSLGLVPVGFGWCLLTPGSLWWGFVLSALGGLLWCGVEVANLDLMMEFSGKNDDGAGDAPSGGSAYVAVNNLIVNLAGCFGGLVAGLIAQALRDWTFVTAYKAFTLYDVLFALSAVLRLLAVVLFLPHIHEADARPTLHAMRFLAANLYEGALGAIHRPFRLFVMAHQERRRLRETPAD